MKKVIKESYQDSEDFLRSNELFNEIVSEFGAEFYEDSKEVSRYVIERLSDETGDSAQVESVMICKITGDEVDTVETDHNVVVFNGMYYDYCAQQFNDSFGQLINSGYIPVVQKVVRSESQLRSNLSTLKGYIILGY